MKVKQLYTKCLAQGAYYIESEGVAAVIDPLRDYKPYIQLAQENNAKIKYVFETHFHADFVSGHIDLAHETGAKIVFGPEANPTYTATIAQDNQVFQIGSLTLTVLHTPGHTLESSCYLLKDENGREHALFTGDTLFIGDVGRPDLAQGGVSNLSKEDLAGMLYDSLRARIMPLSDDLIIYPAHGAGSACGKNMSSETYDTLGSQKQTNYALDENLSREAFIDVLTDGIAPPPYYFPENVALNKKGYDSLSAVLDHSLRALDVSEVQQELNDKDVLVLDTRSTTEFAKAHIPKSVFVGIDGGFAPWVGNVITDIGQKMIVVADSGREEEVVTRLARVGYHGVIGFLEGGFKSWLREGLPIDSIACISPVEFVAKMNSEQVSVIDVRKPSEFDKGHLQGALHRPLSKVGQDDQDLPLVATNYVHCAGGYRSLIYASIVQQQGMRLTNVEGGYNAVIAAS